jgi:predicted helicase
MISDIQAYLNTISDKYKRGDATEHSYRSVLEQLIQNIIKEVVVTNEPKRQKCGAPDLIITKKDIPVGFIETKDVNDPLDITEDSEQLVRYRESLDNLILTDYLEFRLFINGVKVDTVRIGHVERNKIIIDQVGLKKFETLLKDFCNHQSQTITSSEQLAKMMAAKARLMQLVLENALSEDQKDELNGDTSIQQQYLAFKDILIHDIKPSEFADIYAQTIAYGMFAARLHDTTPENFTRREAAELIPKSNPFLRRLFQYIAGFDLDIRLSWIVDSLADVFRATDIKQILKNFGKVTQKNDPVIHFYETFLTEYNPALRKSRGVWFTPEPIVNFIVRAVDDILISEFKLKDGLASTETTEIEIETQQTDNRTKDNIKKAKIKVHKVQLLDPATGTGTFLSEVVKQIHEKFANKAGVWPDYVDKHLIPRLNGFEILMASYAMCHLKLELLLAETGYNVNTTKRLRVYLTNSLEEAVESKINLFAQWLSNEAIEANNIKRDSPLMVVLGNPPYSILSSNLSPKQRALVEKYKYVDGIKIKEKGALQFEIILNDDYVKFLSLGENFITRTSEGVLAYINNHNFLDSPELRGLRWSLATSFDKIFIIDLHGNSQKKEVDPTTGKPDPNVFLIKQGVSINIFVKTGKKSKGELAKIYHSECWGSIESKFNFLNENDLKSIKFTEVIPNAENYYLFVPRNQDLESEYQTFISIKDLFLKDSTGIISARDNMIIDKNPEALLSRVELFGSSDLDDKSLCDKFDISLKKGWEIGKARNRVSAIKNPKELIHKILYRPFDTRYIFYDDSLVWTTARPIMSNFLDRENYGLILGKKGQVVGPMQWNLGFITDSIADFNLFYRGGINLFPLYIYHTKSEQTKMHATDVRIPNLNPKIISEISSKLGLTFETEKLNNKTSFSPIDLLDYIYAVIHSPNYRERYKDFLKTAFPRIPYPTNKTTFWNLVKLGGELRELHLFKSGKIEKYVSDYSVSGDNAITQIKFQKNKVFINKTQYFDKVDLEVWEFYIGGYQPAQKWLKDLKKDKTNLSYDDVIHYQRILSVISLTRKLMNEIDEILVFTDAIEIPEKPKKPKGK